MAKIITVESGHRVLVTTDNNFHLPIDYIFSDAESVSNSEQYSGYCIACGCYHDSGIEPDARKYRFEGCGKPSVYSSVELVFMV